MRMLLVILVLTSCISCAKRAPLPESDLEFISVGRSEESALLDVRFSSNTDLLRFFEEKAGQNQVGDTLICSLDKNGHFVTKQDLVRYLEGEVAEVESETSGGKHFYSAEVFAVYTPDGGTLSKFISKEQLLSVLGVREDVACKFRTAAYSYGPYYSNPMKVPASAFTHAIEQKREQ